MARYRVLHIDTERKLGGGERQLRYLVDNLDPTEFESLVVVRESEELRRFFGKGAVYLDFGHFDECIDVLVRLVKRFSIDIVHAHTGLAANYAVLLKPFVRGVVATRRVSIPVRNPVSRVKYSLMDKVVVVSRSMIDELSFLGRDRLCWIESALDRRFWNCPERGDAIKYLGLDEGKRYICGVGKVEKMKGFGILVRAMSRIRGVELLIAGSGDLNPVRELSYSLGVSNRVHFLGFVEDPRYVYVASDVCVVSSIFGEGSPAVIKESLACGVPVVATDVGGARDIIGKNGIVVPPGNVEALKDAIEVLLSEDRSGKKICFDRSKFLPSRMGDRYAWLYKEIIMGKSFSGKTRWLF